VEWISRIVSLIVAALQAHWVMVFDETLTRHLHFFKPTLVLSYLHQPPLALLSRVTLMLQFSSVKMFASLRYTLAISSSSIYQSIELIVRFLLCAGVSEYFWIVSTWRICFSVYRYACDAYLSPYSAREAAIGYN
jgi:hypothetical protein